MKNMKPLQCREIHSLQVNDSIASLCPSASRQQLPPTQQQHAQQQQPLHAPHHKTSKQKRTQTKQLQLQHANSQEKGTEALQETALLAGQRFDCQTAHIDIASAAPARTTATRAATTTPACPAPKIIKTKTDQTAAAAVRKLTRERR
jgi:hypothetical protein